MLNITGLNQFYGESHILRDVNMAVKAGSCACLMGRNGVGKTTLLQCIMGVLPARSGHIFLEKTDLLPLPVERRAALGVGYVPQGRQIFPLLTVRENMDAALGIIKADLGIRDGRIAAIGKAGNPDVQPDVDVIIGPGTEIIAGEGCLLTAGGMRLRKHYNMAVVTNDIYTREDAEFLLRHNALEADRIIGVETGGCPHTAIREDASMTRESRCGTTTNSPTAISRASTSVTARCQPEISSCSPSAAASTERFSALMPLTRVSSKTGKPRTNGFLSHALAHPGNFAHRQRAQKVVHLFRPQNKHAVGLVDVRAYLGQKLHRGHPGRAAQPARGLPHPRLHVPRRSSPPSTSSNREGPCRVALMWASLLPSAWR